MPRIAAAGHEIAISAFCGIQGTTTAWNNSIPVFPGGLEAYGNDILPGHAKRWGADLVITLMDAWVLDPGMAGSLGMACWMPVDCTPLSAMDREFLRASGVTPIAMSEHGVRELTGAGFSPLYAPHCVDTSVYAPVDKAAARAALGVPQDAYAIGINMANIDAVRKGFPEQMSAFAMFRSKHPEALLLMHSHQTGPGTGMNLGDIIGRLGIGDAVRWTNSYQYTCGGYSPQEMARWYACLDVYSGCSYAEGFGLPLLEAAACGIPVVATDFLSHTSGGGPARGPGRRGAVFQPPAPEFLVQAPGRRDRRSLRAGVHVAAGPGEAARARPAVRRGPGVRGALGAGPGRNCSDRPSGAGFHRLQPPRLPLPGAGILGERAGHRGCPGRVPRRARVP